MLELSNGIAVSYCGKMFADGGANVVKIESPQGDSLRCWSAGGPAGALFDYLAAGKKSVTNNGQPEIASLLAGADIVLTDLMMAGRSTRSRLTPALRRWWWR